ncbi:hypothetical protein HK099_003815 [Clydaea vesicula]|uniref:Uncharacterized protein n=1 Tax=Clydaea vesicula TaxID=447962 RepID=A0AAD5U4E8_9FUNG|nr:hypothetical protein HK099_003815 [Clydaea vesicula]
MDFQYALTLSLELILDQKLPVFFGKISETWLNDILQISLDYFKKHKELDFVLSSVASNEKIVDSFVVFKPSNSTRVILELFKAKFYLAEKSFLHNFNNLIQTGKRINKLKLNSGESKIVVKWWKKTETLLLLTVNYLSMSSPLIITGENNFSKNYKNYASLDIWPILIRNASLNYLSKFDLLKGKDNGCLNEQFAVSKNKLSSNSRFTIKILTYNRPNSLRRLLNSLSNSNYEILFLNGSNFNSINVDIFIDYPKLPNLSNLIVRKEVLKVAENWEWKYGEKLIHVRYKNVGLAAQWHEVWYPDEDDNEVAFILEDDLEMWFTWLSTAVNKYYFDTEEVDPRAFGISLQGQQTCLRIYPKCYVNFQKGQIHGLEEGNSFPVYKYQLVGTWGQLLFPTQWRKFLSWLDLKMVHKKSIVLDKQQQPHTKFTLYQPLFGNLKSNLWFKHSSDKGAAWTFHFIAFVAEKGLYNLYPDFREKALAVNHREPGVHYQLKLSTDKYILDLEEWEQNKKRYLNLAPKSLEEVGCFDFSFNFVKNVGALEFRNFALLNEDRN